MADYTFFPAEGGILAEILLAKKAHFQGALYRSLTEGFDLAKVQEHFNDPAKATKIASTLKYFDPALANYTTADIENFPDVLFGYSMYEVDGVFATKSVAAAAGGKRTTVQIQEERTQIVRIIFKPDLDAIATQVLKLSDPTADRAPYADGGDERHSRVRHDIRRFLRDRADRNIKIETASEQILWDHIRRWQKYCGLFLFGYIIFNICDLILPAGTKVEDEIWVTSLWDVAINRMVLNSPPPQD